MKIYSTIGRLIDKYGTEVFADNEKTKAFIQPLRYNAKYYGTMERKTAGMVTSKRFLYIGKPDVRLICDKSVIQTDDDKYIVRRCDIYRTGERGAYTYAVLAPCGEVLEDEYESDNGTA